MPKDKLQKNTGFKLNPVMQMTTSSMGLPGYDPSSFMKKNEEMMANIKDKISDFAHTTKVFGEIDKRSGEYLKIVNDSKIGISGSAENNPVQRMFTKGTHKKYPYLYSRFDANAKPDYGAIFAGNNSNMRITDDQDFVQFDSKGGVSTYQNVDQNTLRAQNYLKNLNIAGRAWHGHKDKGTLLKAEHDAKLSSDTFDTLSAALKSGNISAADDAIKLANIQYNPGKGRIFQSQASAFLGEQFHGPVGNTFSGQNLNQIIFNTGNRGGGYHAGQYMDKGYFDRVGTHNRSIIPSSDGQVKFEHRRMLGGFNTLHNIAKKVQTDKNIADKESYDINKDWGYQFKKIGDKVKNMNTKISIPKTTFTGFDTKSGGFNFSNLLNIKNKDSKSNE